MRMGRSVLVTNERLGLVGVVRFGLGGGGGLVGVDAPEFEFDGLWLWLLGAVSEEGVVRAEREVAARRLADEELDEVEAEEGMWDSERWEVVLRRIGRGEG